MSQVKFKTGLHTWSSRRDRRKRQTIWIGEWQALGKGTYIGVFGDCKLGRSPRLPTRILKVIQRPYLGLVMYTIQRVSRTCCFLKAASLKTAFTVGIVGSTFQGQGRRFGAFDCLGPACESPRGHILLRAPFKPFLLPHKGENHGGGESQVSGHAMKSLSTDLAAFPPNKLCFEHWNESQPIEE